MQHRGGYSSSSSLYTGRIIPDSGPNVKGFRAERPPTGKRSGTDPVSRRGSPSYLQKFSSESGKVSVPRLCKANRGSSPAFLGKILWGGSFRSGALQPLQLGNFRLR